MSHIVVRNSTDADMSAVQCIYAYYVLHGLGTFEEEPPSVAELQRRRDEVLGDGLPYLVAEIDGGVSGKGVGRALLSAVITRCEAGRWRQMIAVIGDSDNVASIRLHERLGFRLVGTFRAIGFKMGRWVDTVLMQRELGVSDRTPPRSAHVVDA